MKNTIPKIYYRAKNNANNVDDLKLIHTFENNQLFSKKTVEVLLVENYEPHYLNHMDYAFEFHGFPDQFLQATNIVEIYNTVGGFVMDKSINTTFSYYQDGFSFESGYHWKAVDDVKILKYYIRAWLRKRHDLSYIVRPLYLNVYLTIKNPNEYYEIQHTKI